LSPSGQVKSGCSSAFQKIKEMDQFEKTKGESARPLGKTRRRVRLEGKKKKKNVRDRSKDSREKKGGSAGGGGKKCRVPKGDLKDLVAGGGKNFQPPRKGPEKCPPLEEFVFGGMGRALGLARGGKTC